MIQEVSAEPFKDFASSAKTNIENAARALAYGTIELISTKEDDKRPDSLPFEGENLRQNKLFRTLEDAYTKLAFASGKEKEDFLQRIAKGTNPTPDLPSWLQGTSAALASAMDDKDADKEYKRYALVAKVFPYALQIAVSSGKTSLEYAKAYMRTLRNMINYNKDKVEKVAEKSPLNK